MTFRDGAEIVGWILLHAFWQATALAAVLHVTLLLLPAYASRARYAAAMATVALACILPITTAGWMLAVDGGPRVGTAAAPAMVVEVADGWRDVLPWLCVAWMIGVAICLARVGADWRTSWRLRTSDVEPAPSAWADALREVARRMDVPAVPLLVSARADVPMVAGVLRPAILLPMDVAARLGPAQARAVLAHELAHVRRRDALVNLAQLAAEALFIHHPAVRWASEVARREREHCCDAAVLAIGADAVAYARALAALEGLRSGGRLALAASEGELLERVRRLVAPRQPAAPAPVGRPAAAGMAGIIIVLLATAAGAGATRPLLPRPFPARMDVRAADAVGEFTLAIERGRVVAASVAGVPVPAERIIHSRDSVYLPAHPRLALRLAPDGIQWDPRPAPR